MRKKELLRQYWTQENMDDSNCAPQQDAQNSASSTTNSGRSGIPKAVDSMSSIPTKDDYKTLDPHDPTRSDLQTSQMSTSYYASSSDAQLTSVYNKKRKIPANRELRQLDVPSYDEMPERRRSVCSNASNTSSSNAGESSKRKTRTKQAVMTTPKLKIKIGSDMIEPSVIGDFVKVKPPKKRLANIALPSLEEIRRDSMNFRKKVISQFNDDTAKPKKNKDKSKREKGKHKKNKKEKEKDKDKDKDKDQHEIKIVNSSKLIIRFAKRKASESSDEASTSGINKVKTTETNPPSPSGKFLSEANANANFNFLYK